MSNGDREATKNRWQLGPATDGRDETIAVALATAATRPEDFAASAGFVVMRVLEGNEFCVLRNPPVIAPWGPPSRGQGVTQTITERQVEH